LCQRYKRKKQDFENKTKKKTKRQKGAELMQGVLYLFQGLLWQRYVTPRPLKILKPKLETVLLFLKLNKEK